MNADQAAAVTLDDVASMFYVAHLESTFLAVEFFLRSSAVRSESILGPVDCERICVYL